MRKFFVNFSWRFFILCLFFLLQNTETFAGPIDRTATESLILNEFQVVGIAQGWHADDAAWSYALPFTFNYYGVNYTNIRVSSNGYICMDDSASCDSTSPDLSSSYAGPIISALGRDLRTDSINDIYILSDTNHVVIRWLAYEYGYTSQMNFEMVLYSDGSIKFNYGSGPTLNHSAVVGLSNGAGTYLASTYNGRTNFNNVQTSYWSSSSLRVDAFDPADDAIEVSENTSLQMIFDTAVIANVGNVTILKYDDDSEIQTIPISSPLITGWGTDTLVIDIDPLIRDTEYYVMIDADAIKDGDDNYFSGITNESGWNFHTRLSAPMDVLNVDPVDNAQFVTQNSPLHMTFNADVLAGDGDITIYKSSDDSISQTISIASPLVTGWGTDTLTIDIGDLVLDTNYYVFIDGNAIKNSDNVHFVGFDDNVQWNFHTRPSGVKFSLTDDLDTQDRIDTEITEARWDDDAGAYTLWKPTGAWSHADRSSEGNENIQNSGEYTGYNPQIALDNNANQMVVWAENGVIKFTHWNGENTWTAMDGSEGSEDISSSGMGCGPGVCGDGTCDFENGENVETCSDDCHGENVTCGDDICHANLGEDQYNCWEDCSGGSATCGNELCEINGGENLDNCSVDCMGYCGNGLCESDLDESEYTCSEDCSTSDNCRVASKPQIIGDQSGNPIVAWNGYDNNEGVEDTFARRWDGTKWAGMDGQSQFADQLFEDKVVSEDVDFIMLSDNDGNPTVIAGGTETLLHSAWDGTKWTQKNGGDGYEFLSSFGNFYISAADFKFNRATNNPIIVAENSVSGPNVSQWNGSTWSTMDGTSSSKFLTQSMSMSPDPVELSDFSGVLEISLGDQHACARMNDGTVQCWGHNSFGQLGNGSDVNSKDPVTVLGLSNVVEISAGSYHTCARLSDNTMSCWGRNVNGQLGNNSLTQSNVPVTVSGLSNVVEMSSGGEHTCARLSDNTMRCWGLNNNGQIGDNTLTKRMIPVPVSGLSNVVEMSSGGEHTCARLSDNTMSCWGRNVNGQLGDGTTTRRTLPTLVLGLSNVVEMSSGGEHTCARLSDNTMSCWGYNYGGQTSYPFGLYNATPYAVAGLSTVSEITAGGEHTCARLSDNTMKCWGNNGRGQIGDSTFVSNAVPQTLSSLTAVAEISSGYYFTCARLSDNTMRCWGDNDNGQLQHDRFSFRDLKMQIDKEGNPIIAYVYSDIMRGGQNIGLSKWNGNAWVLHRLSVPDYISDLQFELGENDTPILAWTDESDVFVTQWNENEDDWFNLNGEVEGFEQITDGGEINDIQIQMTSRQYPMLIWSHWTPHSTHFTQWNGVNWVRGDDETEGNDMISDPLTTTTIDIVLNENDEPSVVWSEQYGDVHFSMLPLNIESPLVVQSTKLNESITDIVSAKLTADDDLEGESYIEYYLSSDGGEMWNHVNSGQELIFAEKTSDVRWRAVLYKGSMPTLNSVHVNFSTESITPTCGEAARTYSINETEFSGENYTPSSMNFSPASMLNMAVKTFTNIVPAITIDPIITPTCGDAAKTYTYDETTFAGTLCGVGTEDSTPVFPVQGASSAWNCVGTSETVACNASREVEPASEDIMCASGTIDITPSFPELGQTVMWQCQNSTDNVMCSANRAETIIATCGTAAKTYVSTATSFFGGLCTSGTIDITPVFPEKGQMVSWHCQGTSENKICSANRDGDLVPESVDQTKECSTDSTKDVTKNSVILRATVDESYKNDNVKFKIDVKNVQSDEKETIKISETPSDNGKVNLLIDNLLEDTEYEFKVSYEEKDEYLYCPHSKTAKTLKTELITEKEKKEAACGNAAKTYAEDEIEFSGDFCAEGAIDENPLFPAQGAQVSWVCASGDSTKDCSAQREKKNIPVPIVKGGSDPKPVSPEEKKPQKEALKPVTQEPIYQSIATVGIAMGTMLAFATSAVPLFVTVPMAAKDFFIMPFIGLLARRRNEQNWGTVFEKNTKQPIPGVKLMLTDQGGKEIETTYSDQHGRFGFLTANGTFIVESEKAKYDTIHTIQNDSLYGDVYTGDVITIDENKVIAINIAMSAKNVDWTEYAQKKASAYKGFFSMTKKWVFILVFYAGFIATAIITYYNPSTTNFIFVALYAVLFVFDNFIKKKKYGTVETVDDKPVPFAIVSLYDKESQAKKTFAVTDVIGRYYLLAENGNYNLKIKGQPIGGHNFEKQGDIHVRNGLVRKDVKI